MEGYYFLDDLIVRCPAKPVGLYIDYCSDPINAVFQDPNLEQAILLASPSLHYDLCRYSLLDSKRQVKCRNAVMRYLARLSHRCDIRKAGQELYYYITPPGGSWCLPSDPPYTEDR